MTVPTTSSSSTSCALTASFQTGSATDTLLRRRNRHAQTAKRATERAAQDHAMHGEIAGADRMQLRANEPMQLRQGVKRDRRAKMMLGVIGHVPEDAL